MPEVQFNMLKYFNVESTKIACWINSQDFGKKKQSLIFIHGSGGDHSQDSGSDEQASHVQHLGHRD